MKNKMKQTLQWMKSWTWIEWIINFRFIGYGLLLLRVLNDGTFTVVEGMAFCVIIGLMEKKAKTI